MLYFLAIVLPPVAVLLAGKPIQALLNFFLTLLGWVPGMIHAVLVVLDHKADKRAKKYGHRG
ncbi:YqaE/Pmp3 family membrane protein [Bacillus sp. B15-48]|uniref:YqaE/Pmp3 family membrane protein n=1 Tax=Bacillus sp. B15-48 TaxID=1548601 RepID=UPI00193F20E1|nr:YqaE/Pmp3 family membrane protein [Bacillus sp. B15-48]MBM4763144.1 YqaE/Pmp3 family membrane protein [Bacillus sp. B15-48]